VTLIKTVVNDDGGTLSEGAFHPCIEGLPASWAKPVPLAAGTHTLTKTVVNDNGGTLTRGDFEPYLDGTPPRGARQLPCPRAVTRSAKHGFPATLLLPGMVTAQPMGCL
jgi:hypothetical protein